MLLVFPEFRSISLSFLPFTSGKGNIFSSSLPHPLPRAKNTLLLMPKVITFCLLILLSKGWGKGRRVLMVNWLFSAGPVETFQPKFSGFLRLEIGNLLEPFSYLVISRRGCKLLQSGAKFKFKLTNKLCFQKLYYR